MPRHQRVMTCCKDGGVLSEGCSCQHCTSWVCAVCGFYDGGLTTDCPGVEVSYEQQREVYEMPLDYTDARGWHLAERSPAELKGRSRCFATEDLSPVDPRSLMPQPIGWAGAVQAAQHTLSRKAIVWARADRLADDRAAMLTRLEDEEDQIAALAGEPLNKLTHAELRKRLEHEKIEFQRASRLAEKCDEEFRQAAQHLVEVLEQGPFSPFDDVQGGL